MLTMYPTSNIIHNISEVKQEGPHFIDVEADWK